ncbi:MAG: hypothetical protein WDW36_003604 [Sanguina aurantia]
MSLDLAGNSSDDHGYGDSSDDHADVSDLPQLSSAPDTSPDNSSAQCPAFTADLSKPLQAQAQRSRPVADCLTARKTLGLYDTQVPGSVDGQAQPTQSQQQQQQQQSRFTGSSALLPLAEPASRRHSLKTQRQRSALAYPFPPLVTPPAPSPLRPSAPQPALQAPPGARLARNAPRFAPSPIPRCPPVPPMPHMPSPHPFLQAQQPLLPAAPSLPPPLKPWTQSYAASKALKISKPPLNPRPAPLSRPPPAHTPHPSMLAAVDLSRPFEQMSCNERYWFNRQNADNAAAAVAASTTAAVAAASTPPF